MKTVVRYLINASVLLLCFQTSTAQQFVHPGLLQSREDLARIKNGVAMRIEPIFTGYNELKDNRQSQFDYKMQGPMEMVGRNPTVGQGVYDADANAAYQNAIMWAITADQRYAEKAKQIIDAWASTLKSITGRDAVLMAGLGPFKMVNAAEILRYTNSNWAPVKIKQAEKHFKEVIYPVIKDFAPFANGNWDSAALKTMMAIAVFCNDRPMFERAIVYYQYGEGNGSLPNYIINEEGQCQESGRDQSHTQLGIAHLADCAEIAWQQGLNLYGILNDRLLRGFEYTAKYNLGENVPYLPAMDRTGKYLHAQIATEGRGKLRAVYEEVFNHYVHRANKTATFTQKAAEKVRPEPQGTPGADHIGFGTLLYSRSLQTIDPYAKVKPCTPSGLTAMPENRSIQLTWVPVRGAIFYQVKRAINRKGKFKIISTRVTNAQFQDKNVAPGRKYVYTVSAVNNKGKSTDAYPAAVTAGLPAGWSVTDLDPKSKKGQARSLESGFTVEGNGLGFTGNEEQATYIHHKLVPYQTLAIHYQPQLTSQFTGFGISFRQSAKEKGIGVNLLIYPEVSQQLEAPKWVVTCTARLHPGDSLTQVGATLDIKEPVISFNRMTGGCWLKLVQEQNQVNAFYSADGKDWQLIGTVARNLSLTEAGIIVFSGLEAVSTTVRFDQVRLE